MSSRCGGIAANPKGWMWLQGDVHAEVSSLQDEPTGLPIFWRLPGFHVWLPHTAQCLLRSYFEQTAALRQHYNGFGL